MKKGKGGGGGRMTHEGENECVRLIVSNLTASNNTKKLQKVLKHLLDTSRRS